MLALWVHPDVGCRLDVDCSIGLSIARVSKVEMKPLRTSPSEACEVGQELKYLPVSCVNKYYNR
jgi:hypothetical protein